MLLESCEPSYLASRITNRIFRRNSNHVLLDYEHFVVSLRQHGSACSTMLELQHLSPSFTPDQKRIISRLFSINLCFFFKPMQVDSECASGYIFLIDFNIQHFISFSNNNDYYYNNNNNNNNYYYYYYNVIIIIIIVTTTKIH